MKTQKGCLSILIASILAAIAIGTLLYWYQETHPSRYEYVDSKGEKHIARYCSDNAGWFRQAKPSCSLEDGTEVFDVVSYKLFGGEE